MQGFQNVAHPADNPNLDLGSQAEVFQAGLAKDNLYACFFELVQLLQNGSFAGQADAFVYRTSVGKSWIRGQDRYLLTSLVCNRLVRAQRCV